VKERKDRVDDAMHATRAGRGGCRRRRRRCAPLRHKALDKLKIDNHDQKVGVDIVRRALQTPVRQIVENSGADGSVVSASSRQERSDHGYDAQTGAYSTW